MNWRHAFVISICCVFLMSCDRNVEVFYSDKWEFQYENSEEWTESWPGVPGNYKIKTSIDLKDSYKKNESYSLYLDMLASSIVYWDGIEIGRNGLIGDSAESEIPGPKVSFFKIPDSLIYEGVHHVELLISNHHAGEKPRFYLICAMETFEIGRNSLIRTAFIHIYAGCFLIIGLFYLVRYLTNRIRNTHLIFSLLSITFFSLIIIEYLRYYYYYPYTWHFTRLQIIIGVTLLIGLLLPLFFLYLFEIKKKWWIMLLILLIESLCLTVISGGYDYATSLIMLCGFTSASIIAFTVLKENRLEVVLALAGLTPVVITMLIWPFYYDYIVYIGFGNLTIIMLIMLALGDRKTRQEKEKASLRSARLELELLKKNIQPHFMKNTLTSAIDWIERNPAKGTDLIFALVEEFDLLLSISNKQMIPLSQELELCSKHLLIMSFRKEIKYNLITENMEEAEKILVPPAILLTVIENGISHNQSRSKDIKFKIERSVEGNKISFRIHCNGDYPHKSSFIEGTGTKYIKARLEESYPGAWTYNSFRVKSGWETIIEWQ